jgi:hypothetical protein
VAHTSRRLLSRCMRPLSGTRIHADKNRRHVCATRDAPLWHFSVGALITEELFNVKGRGGARAVTLRYPADVEGSPGEAGFPLSRE